VEARRSEGADAWVGTAERRRIARWREGVTVSRWTSEVMGWGVIMDWTGWLVVVVVTGLKFMIA
jgi:hypothetical protein